MATAAAASEETAMALSLVEGPPVWLGSTTEGVPANAVLSIDNGEPPPNSTVVAVPFVVVVAAIVVAV